MRTAIYLLAIFLMAMGLSYKKTISDCVFTQEYGSENNLIAGKAIDISWPLTAGVTTYRNRGDFAIKIIKNWEEHNARESLLEIGSHVGTHIDAPAHFLETGKNMESIALEKLMGSAQILDLSFVQEGGITREHLEKYTLHAPRVLLKTRNSKLSPEEPFDSAFIYLEKSGAEYLAEQKIVCVGIDYLGIERGQPHHPTHQILLKQEIVIIEGLRLEAVSEGLYTLVCLPLAVTGVEGAPARAVLLPE